MTTQQISFQILPYGTATLNFPEFLTPDTFASLDSAVSKVLGEPTAAASNREATDPGAVEFDSWLVQLR